MAAEYDLSDVNLPFSKVAEENVIGAVLVDGTSVVLGDMIAAALSPEHFYITRNRRIFELMNQEFLLSHTVDIVTMIDACTRHGIFENETEAKTYLMALADGCSSVSAGVTYAKVVTENYLRRALIVAAKDIIDAANNSSEHASNIVDYAEQKIYDIGAGVENKSLTRISGIVFDRIKALNTLVQESQANGGKPVMTGIPTGFTELDKRIYGLNKSDLLIIAARPGMGKTSFAMNIAANSSRLAPKKQVCIFSLEMSKEQIVSRMICSEARISSDVLKTGRITPDETTAFMSAAETLQDLEIYIDDTPGCNVMSIQSKLRRMSNLGIVIIDYLQLMNSVNNYHGNRVSEVSEITRSLKVMAKNLNVPVIVLSQLARGPEQRQDKRPLLSDLRDSGSIEQDADIVMFLYRDGYYDQTSPNPNVCECIVAKNRHGEVGTTYLGWRGESTRFMNIEVNHQQPGGGGR